MKAAGVDETTLATIGTTSVAAEVSLQQRLATLEKRVELGLKTFIEVGEALREIREVWRATTWFIEGDISDCLDPWSYCSFAHCAC